MRAAKKKAEEEAIRKAAEEVAKRGDSGKLAGATLEGINVAAAAEAGLNSEKIGNTGMLKSNSADNSANGIIGGTMINGMMINGFVKKDIDSIGKE